MTIDTCSSGVVAINTALLDFSYYMFLYGITIVYHDCRCKIMNRERKIHS